MKRGVESSSLFRWLSSFLGWNYQLWICEFLLYGHNIGQTTIKLRNKFEADGSWLENMLEESRFIHDLDPSYLSLYEFIEF